MKANVFASVVIALFLFAINTGVVKAGSDANLYHNVEQKDNKVSTTYYKGNGDNGLVPFKKRINILNNAGLCVSKVTYTWDASAKNWTPLDKMDYVYNGDKVTNIERYAWDSQKNNWSDPQTVSYSYNENGVSAK